VKISFFVFRLLFLVTLVLVATAEAQGPAPETAPPLFPKGALVSYGSDFFSRNHNDEQITSTSQPTFAHHGNFVFTWGFYPNFDLTLSVPVVTNKFRDHTEVSGTSIGDSLILMKYRFYRKDSERGTTQASVTVGPKLPTGGTSFNDSAGILLPASLQAGSGSSDLFTGFNFTYTGLFNIRRLVADEEFRMLLRTKGTQETKLGNDFESRFWLSYRPYESKDIRHEWFIGTTLVWVHSADEEIAGNKQHESGGNVLLVGVTTYFGLAPGMHVWLGLEWAVANSHGENFNAFQRHISFGITRQFRFF